MEPPPVPAASPPGPGRRSQKVRNTVIVLCSVLVMVVASLTLFRGPAPASTQPKGLAIGFTRVSRPAPAFTLPRLQGRGVVQARRFRGKPVVINFWSSSCTICKQESPAMSQVARAAHGAVDFVGIDSLDRRSSAISFVRRYHLSYLMAYDAQGVAAGRYDVIGLPMTFFLSKAGGEVIGVNTGALTAHGLVSILRKLYGPAYAK